MVIRKRDRARDREIYREKDGDGDRLNLWEDNVANATLGTEPNAPLAYALGLEHHHPIMSMLGEPGGQ